MYNTINKLQAKRQKKKKQVYKSTVMSISILTFDYSYMLIN